MSKKKLTKEDFDYKCEELRNLKEDKNFLRFEGATCFQCNKSINIPIYKYSEYWECICGYNNRINHNSRHEISPFETPEAGPSRAKISLEESNEIDTNEEYVDKYAPFL